MFCLCSGFNLKTEVSRNAGLDRLLGNVLQINNCMTNNLLYLVIWLETARRSQGGHED